MKNFRMALFVAMKGDKKYFHKYWGNMLHRIFKDDFVLNLISIRC